MPAVGEFVIQAGRWTSLTTLASLVTGTRYLIEIEDHPAWYTSGSSSAVPSTSARHELLPGQEGASEFEQVAGDHLLMMPQSNTRNVKVSVSTIP